MIHHLRWMNSRYSLTHMSTQNNISHTGPEKKSTTFATFYKPWLLLWAISSSYHLWSMHKSKYTYACTAYTLEWIWESYLTKSPFRAGVPEYWMLTSSPWLAHTKWLECEKLKAKRGEKKKKVNKKENQRTTQGKVITKWLTKVHGMFQSYKKYSQTLKFSSKLGCELIVSSALKIPSLLSWNSNIFRPIMLWSHKTNIKRRSMKKKRF